MGTIEELKTKIELTRNLNKACDEAIPMQRMLVKERKDELRSAIRALNHMLLGRKNGKKYLSNLKSRLSQLPNYKRKYTLTHLGKVLGLQEEAAIKEAMKDD